MSLFRMKKTVLIAVTLLMASPVTFAAKMTMPADVPATYEPECASCHMAYPPALLSQQSWKNIMSGLSKHFGTDASLDPKTLTELTNWLVKNATTRQKYSETAPENRITKTSWFIRKHDEVNADVWKRASIKSPANCGACHIDAANGVFSEKNIKIPAK
jgi:hypothetical protein